jgi:hypothetical protein
MNLYYKSNTQDFSKIGDFITGAEDLLRDSLTARLSKGVNIPAPSDIAKYIGDMEVKSYDKYLVIQADPMTPYDEMIFTQ